MSGRRTNKPQGSLSTRVHLATMFLGIASEKMLGNSILWTRSRIWHRARLQRQLSSQSNLAALALYQFSMPLRSCMRLLAWQRVQVAPQLPLWFGRALIPWLLCILSRQQASSLRRRLLTLRLCHHPSILLGPELMYSFGYYELVVTILT